MNGRVMRLGGALLLILSSLSQAAPPAVPAAQVNVETRFLSIDLNTCSAKCRKIVEPVLAPGAVMILDDQRASDLLGEIQRSLDATLVTAPRLELFSGEEGRMTVVSDTAYISDYAPLVIHPKKPADYKPSVSHAFIGTSLSVTATLAGDHKSFKLALHPTISRLIKMKSEIWKLANDPALEIETPVIETKEITKTLDVPDGKTVVFIVPSNQPTGTQRTIMLAKPTLLHPEPPKPPADQL